MTPQTKFRQARTEQAPQDLQLTDIWKFLLRRRAILAIFCLLGVALGAISYIMAPRLYTAVATVEMNRDATSGLGLQDLSGAGSALGIGQEFMTDMLTQQAVLSNASTSIFVIEHLHLLETPPFSNTETGSSIGDYFGKTKTHSPDSSNERMNRAVMIFQRKLRVTPVKNTRLLEVAYTDADPVRAAQVANAVVEAYLTNHTRTRYEATRKASTWLNQQLDGLKRQAEETREQVTALESENGLVSGTTPSESNVNGESAGSASLNPETAKLLALDTALTQAQLARIQQGTVFRLSETNDPNALLDVSGAKLAAGDNTLLSSNSQSMLLIQTLRNQEASLKLRVASEKVTYAAKNPVMQELQSQLDSVHTQLAEEMEKVRASAKRNYQLAEQNENAIRREVEEQQQKIFGVGNRLADLTFLREEERSGRKLYQDLYTRLQEANIAAGVRSSGMAVVDPARPPIGLSSPNPRRNLGFGALGGFFLGLLIALLVQLRDTKLNIPEDFEANSPYPLLGVVPGFDSGKRMVYGRPVTTAQASTEEAWIARSPHSPVAEAYRLIRTSIMLSRAERPPQVMLFTSPLGGDGKSTTAYNMSAAFAAQSSRVLLLEADMRRPSINKVAGLSKGRGLSDVLSGQVSLDEVIYVSQHIPALSILQAGTIPPDPSELLGSERFGKLISEMRTRFDYIMIDSPPALLVTDPIVASTSADAIVCVLRAGKTEKPALRRFWQTMRQPTTPVIGYVVNDFNRKLQSYAYGYEGYGGYAYQGYSPRQEKSE